MDFLYGSPLTQRFIHQEMPFAGRGNQPVQQLLFGKGIKIRRMSQTVSPRFQRTDGFLERFLIGFADAHDLAYGTHLRSQFILHPFELLKCPAGKFNDHVIAVRHIAVQRPIFTAGNIL